MTTSIRPTAPGAILVPLPSELGLPADVSEAELRTESRDPLAASLRLSVVGDETTADAAIRLADRGALLLYRGDYHNGRQLLAALRRRMEKRHHTRTPTPLAAFETERALRETAHRVLSRLLVAISPEGTVLARRPPDAGAAIEAALGKRDRWVLVPLVELLGMIGAWEWQKKGVTVPGLSAPLTPTYGVFGPLRLEPSRLAAKIPDVQSKTFIDVGTGTGVLSLILLARGAASGIATDLDERAVACATLNARRLGFESRIRVQAADLFPEGTADLVVANPPWIPGTAHTRLDGAIYDPGDRFLMGFFSGLASHLTPGGRGYLILSDFAELVGLRAPDFLQTAAATAGLTLRELAAETPSHPRAKDATDPLHAVRSRERVRLLELRAD